MQRVAKALIETFNHTSLPVSSYKNIFSHGLSLIFDVPRQIEEKKKSL